MLRPPTGLLALPACVRSTGHRCNLCCIEACLSVPRWLDDHIHCNNLETCAMNTGLHFFVWCKPTGHDACQSVINAESRWKKSLASRCTRDQVCVVIIDVSGVVCAIHIATMFILTSAGSCLASVAAVCACQACQGITREVLRKSARLAYCALFTTAMVLAWVLRDFSKPLIEKIPCESQLGSCS